MNMGSNGRGNRDLVRRKENENGYFLAVFHALSFAADHQTEIVGSVAQTHDCSDRARTKIEISERKGGRDCQTYDQRHVDARLSHHLRSRAGARFAGQQQYPGKRVAINGALSTANAPAAFSRVCAGSVSLGPASCAEVMIWTAARPGATVCKAHIRPRPLFKCRSTTIAALTAPRKRMRPPIKDITLEFREK